MLNPPAGGQHNVFKLSNNKQAAAVLIPDSKGLASLTTTPDAPKRKSE